MRQAFARLRGELPCGEAVTISLGPLARTALRCAMVYTFIAAAAASVEAQILTSSFDQLSVLVKRGDSVIVTDDTGRETKGTIAALSPRPSS
jgi:hypothetical protein